MPGEWVQMLSEVLCTYSLSVRILLMPVVEMLWIIVKCSAGLPVDLNNGNA